ncbi:secretin N-terminal domain-containing protein [Candidatus Albibeggiatoa sp. nov. NOAA]|uniref:secretin N-terminal domain-containing protein n=1 Tax=Candidatus Albibeggiatoa sp. nov. NOAA TaxID=3162724 RepID=UPI0032F2F472|nr:hypothetical protein [Thiotrichaceae bacterium]
MLRNNLLFIIILISISACSSVPQTIPLKFPEPLREPIDNTADTESSVVSPVPAKPVKKNKPPAKAVRKPKQTQFENVPRLPSYTSQQTSTGVQVDNTPKLTGAPVQVNVDSLPLPAFINEIYGNVLGLSFEIDKGLQKKKDLVTLRVVEPQKPVELYRLSEQVLDNYGVGIVRQGKLLRFVPSKKIPAGQPPLLIQGSALPSVPNSHRPVFQFIPLKVVQNAMVRRWINDAYKGQQIDVSEDSSRNAIILRGKPDVVAQAAEAIRILDQPLMRGRYSTLIEPAFLPAEELTKRLNAVLEAEGYRVGSNAPIIFIPFKSNNTLLAFSADRAVLNHIKAWAIKLDQPLPRRNKGPKQRIYYYAVKNTTANSLNEVLSQLLGDVLSTQTTTKNKKNNPKTTTAEITNRLVVDETRNVLIFYGEPQVWSQVLPIVKRLDTPAKQVLIEVTIAQITLTDNTRFGIEWTIREAGIGGFKGTALTDLNVGSEGLSYVPLSSSGQTRAVLNAFAKNDQVTVLSTPTIMVRSGENANITVGEEVPIITSQATSSNINTGIIQNVQYRKTGTNLSVKPVVYSESQVDLEISQSASTAAVNELSSVPSPIIRNNSIKTSLSLADGGSVLLGGLISTDKTISDIGIPLLKDIPVLGHLFRSDSENIVRSELVMLIIPYVLNNSQQAEDITEAFRDKLSIIEPQANTQPLITDEEQSLLSPVDY